VKFPCARIDPEALRHNLAAVRRLAPHSRVLAIIKANAYGHGLVPVANALVEADALGVARLEEGQALRAAGITREVVLLEGVFSRAQLAMAAEGRFQLVVHSLEQVRMLELYRGDVRFEIWLKIDTGMNRLGLRAEEFADAYHRLRPLAVISRLRLMTHLACAEDPAGTVTAQQLARFASLTSGIEAELSIANSAGLILSPQSHTDWVRPGLMLYGISPTAQPADELGLRAVMTLTTQIIAVRDVNAGEAVGYGGAWRAGRASRIGIAAVGYGDGYPRHMRSGTPVLINGREASVVGRVSMDMTAIDLTDHPAARLGDEVTLWGEGLPAERVAPYAGMIPYELVCGVSQRVALQWLGGFVGNEQFF